MLVQRGDRGEVHNQTEATVQRVGCMLDTSPLIHAQNCAKNALFQFSKNNIQLFNILASRPFPRQNREQVYTYPPPTANQEQKQVK